MGTTNSNAVDNAGAAPVDDMEVKRRELLQNGIQLFVTSFADGSADVQQVQKWLELWRSLDDGIDFSLRGIGNSGGHSRQWVIAALSQRIGADVLIMADADFETGNLESKTGVKSLQAWHGSQNLARTITMEPRLEDLARASLGVTEASSLRTLESTCHQILNDLRARSWARSRYMPHFNNNTSVQEYMCRELMEQEAQLQELESTIDETTANPQLTQRAEVESTVLKSRQNLILYWKGRELLREYLEANFGGSLWFGDRTWNVHYWLDDLPTERIIALLDDDGRPDSRNFAAGANNIKEELLEDWRNYKENGNKGRLR